MICFAHSFDRLFRDVAASVEEKIIEGVKTTIPYQQKIMEEKNFNSGKFDTSFLESFFFAKVHLVDTRTNIFYLLLTIILTVVIYGILIFLLKL